MTKPLPLSDFARLPPVHRTAMLDGLSAQIDEVAARAAESHRFLRYGWFAAAIAAYGGRVRTFVVEQDGRPVIALPVVPVGPALLGMATVPGSYWPLRSFPADPAAGPDAFAALLGKLDMAALRIGPAHADDAGIAPLVAAARMRGWAVIERGVGESYAFAMADAARDGWPRGSTLKKNRFHEKHLAGHGALDWRLLSGTDLADGGFDLLARVEEKSWIADRTDGGDAKFTATGHGAFWRAAAADPAIRAMLSAALLTVDGVPAAFSFDLNVGSLKYAIANSFDPAFGKHSPGKLLYYRNLVRALADGITRVDWGAGDSGYKRVIGATPGPELRDWLLLRPGAPAWAGVLIRRFWRSSGRRPDRAGAAPPEDTPTGGA